MQQFGSKERFATVVGPPTTSLRHVEIWAAGKCLTPVDQEVYVPSFTYAVNMTLARLHKPVAFARHESAFSARGISVAYRRLASQADPVAWRELRLFDWGPTTDDVLCFLLPMDGVFYLAWQQRAYRKIHRILVLLPEIAGVLENTLTELGASNAPARGDA